MKQSQYAAILNGLNIRRKKRFKVKVLQRSKTLPVMHMQPEIVLQCQSENIKNQSSKSEHTAINEDVKKKYEVSAEGKKKRKTKIT